METFIFHQEAVDLVRDWTGSLHLRCVDRLPLLAADMVALVCALPDRADALLFSASGDANQRFAPLGGIGSTYFSARIGKARRHLLPRGLVFASTKKQAIT